MSTKIKPHPKLDSFIDFMSEINENALSATGLEAAIIGYVERIGSEPLIAFSRSKVMEILMTEEGLTEEEAMEHFEFNIIGSWNGEGTPVFFTEIDEAVL